MKLESVTNHERKVLELLLRRAYPQVKSLLGACFNQDWGCDYESWEALIDEYYCNKNSEFYSAIGNMKIIEELEDLLEFLTEEQLKLFFNQFIRAEINPEEEGYTYSGWLEAVLYRIKACNS
jgi:hypothetical protein